MASIGTLVHKSAMSIYDQSALQRNVYQAFLAGFKKIIISSHPSTANNLEKLFNENFSKTNENYIEILSNQKHEEGVLTALLYILEIINFSRVTLSLSDIFFIENPYFLLRENINTSINILAVTSLFNSEELLTGGIVICNDIEIKSIKESPAKNNLCGVKWTGAAVFDSNLRQNLKEFLLHNHPDSQIGDFFEYCRAEGVLFEARKAMDFININTPDDLFVASLYRAIELNKDDYLLTNKLIQIIRVIRTKSIKRQIVKLYGSHIL